jgi:hypothetical protein
MADIIIKPEEIVVDENGKVSIKNKILEAAIQKKRGKIKSDVEGQASDFDICGNFGCGRK